MPNGSCRIFASGATAWTVEDAFETIRCSLVRDSSLIPLTTVMSTGSTGGAQRMTRFAPA